MYGGVIGTQITDEFWQFNMTSKEWLQVDLPFIQSEHSDSQWHAVAGHTAHVIDGTMYVIFGRSPVYGYMNLVQECDLSKYLECNLRK